MQSKHKGRKVPQSVKVHKRVEAEVALALSNQALEYEKILKQQDSEARSNESDKIQKLRITLSQRESQLDHLQLDLVEKKKLLITQGQRSNELSERVRDLKHEVSQKQQTITRLNNDLELSQSQFVTAEILPFVNKNLVVHNWKDSWKWISNWCFGLVMFFAVTPIPPEFLAVLPENIRGYMIAWTAFCGLVGRYLNQSK